MKRVNNGNEENREICNVSNASQFMPYDKNTFATHSRLPS